MDSTYEAIADGRRRKFLIVMDEDSCLCLVIRLGRRFKIKDVAVVLEKLTSFYSAPIKIRKDNCFEFLTHAFKR